MDSEPPVTQDEQHSGVASNATLSETTQTAETDKRIPLGEAVATLVQAEAVVNTSEMRAISEQVYAGMYGLTPEAQRQMHDVLVNKYPAVAELNTVLDFLDEPKDENEHKAVVQAKRQRELYTLFNDLLLGAYPPGSLNGDGTPLTKFTDEQIRKNLDALTVVRLQGNGGSYSFIPVPAGRILADFHSNDGTINRCRAWDQFDNVPTFQLHALSKGPAQTKIEFTGKPPYASAVGFTPVVK